MTPNTRSTAPLARDQNEISGYPDISAIWSLVTIPMTIPRSDRPKVPLVGGVSLITTLCHGLIGDARRGQQHRHRGLPTLEQVGWSLFFQTSSVSLSFRVTGCRQRLESCCLAGQAQGVGTRPTSPTKKIATSPGSSAISHSSKKALAPSAVSHIARA